MKFPTCVAPPRERELGFTLVETMVTVAILAILAAIAAPNFRTLVDSYRVNSARDAILDSFQFARAEAVRTGQAVRIQRQTGCTPNNWGCGWIIYRDTNGNGAQDANEPTIRSKEELPNISISSNNAATANAVTVNNFGQLGGTSFSYFIGPVADSESLSCTRIIFNFGMRANIRRSTETTSECP